MKGTFLTALVLCGLALSVGTAQAQSIAAEEHTKAAPVIISPAEIAELRGVSDVKFIWKTDGEGGSYHMVLAKDRRFKRVVSEARDLTGTTWTVEGLDFGTYFAKICAARVDGTDGPCSETRTFILTPEVLAAPQKKS